METDLLAQNQGQFEMVKASRGLTWNPGAADIDDQGADRL
jgi:hypothetical protein